MDGSDIVVEGPRCSLRSRKVYSDLYVDYLKMFLLNVPAAVVALGLFFFLDDLTGFEITYLLELPEPFSFIFTWFAAIPVILWLSQTFTNFIVKDFLILKGPCPNCGTENTSFFGTILSISNGGSTNIIKCTKHTLDDASRGKQCLNGGIYPIYAASSSQLRINPCEEIMSKEVVLSLGSYLERSAIQA